MRPLAALVGVILVVGALWFFVATRPPSTTNRINAVVAGSPMTVVSWDMSDNSFVIVRIPSDYVVNALWGYGNYSLDALWRLGFIDKKGGALLSDSLSDSFGLPINWYIGTKDQNINGEKVFSLSHMLDFTGKLYQTNMPIGTFIAFSKALSVATPDKRNTIDLAKLNVATSEVEPDGSTRAILSPDLLDHALSGAFEQTTLRSEALSVALYNTTTVPSLGNRASRLLTNAGILVVAVGNDEPQVSSCELTGGEKPLSSKTAAYIVSVFGCKKKISEDNKRADLTLRLGTDFAKRFMPSAANH